MRKIKVKQHDITDCAAACLASVAASYKLNLPLARIRQYASTDSKGTNVLGLIQAAERLGFSARGVKGPFESLDKIPLPAIAHVVVKGTLHHFVVVVKVSAQHLRIMDPADGGIHKISAEKFKEMWTGVLVLLLPAEKFKAGNEKVPVLGRFWHLLRPHRPVLLQVLFGALVYTLLGLSTSVFVQKIVDHVLPSGNRNLLNLMGVIMITLLLLQVFINHIKTVMTLKSGQQIDARLVLGYYRHLFRLPQRFFDTISSGEIISRINDAFRIRLFINEALVTCAVNIFILLFSFGLMFTYYWKLALVMLVAVPLYALIYHASNRANRKTQRQLMERSAELESQLVESLRAAGTIRRFGLQDFANTKMEGRFIRLLRTAYVSSLNSLWAGNSSGFVSSLFTIVLLWTGAGFVLQTWITPGELLSFYALFGYFTGPVISLIGMNRTIQDALIAAGRLFEIMDLDQEEKGQKMELTRGMAGPICFNNIKFRYGARASLFNGLNLCIPRAKITALVGESGSGKSTLSSLLQRVYPLESGNITIGDVDIHYFDVESLRRLIGVVPQQIHLFSGTVIENIALGEFEPDLQKVLSICGRLGMMEFIEKLPQGLHTEIGENGATLSGGQCQLLAIARAVYREPDVLILDEATSSLDTASEKYIRDAIFSLRKEGKTIIMIAHRLSTVCGADRIIVLDNGEIKETGVHRELLQQRGSYYRMWQLQTADMAED
ncbi:peptidase domain-containing ABC transporter [Anseongella ginsenosidimutans]|nr:peptidase domain-containing ABC transporter [Anseongella ginsenosidimutans]QEC51358.1 peptidase domain-containing ABC transporter [Anseongella ginsenosidimutans]